MADEHQFIHEGLQRTQIDEFFETELARAGYGGMDVAKTPMGTQIVLKAEKPGMVIGKGGKNIREITTQLEERFNLDDPQIDVQEVEEPDLNAQIVADRLGNALERGWYFRKAGHTTIDRIMDAGALGAEIVLSGKVTGARSRVENFNRGYVKHNGEPAEAIVDHGQSVAVMKLGTIGVDVKIIPPGADLPDDFEVYEDVEVEEYIEEPEEGVDGLLADIEGEEPEEAPESPDEAPVDTEPEDLDIDAIEETLEEELEGDASEAAEAEAEELMEEMEPTVESVGDISGVGDVKREALSEAGYETVADLRAANEADLAEVEGISDRLAADIKASVGTEEGT